jgi:hypothetical protein
MQITWAQLSDIILETMTETAKDWAELTSQIKQIAELTIQVTDILKSSAEVTLIPSTQTTRGLEQDRLVAEILQKIKDQAGAA